MSDGGARAIDFAVLAQAAEWFALLGGERVPECERERWRDWLAQSAQHRLAWQRVEQIGSHFGELPAAPALRALQAPARTRRHTVQMLGIAGLAAACGWLGGGAQLWRHWSADYRTGIGERRALTLADGSRLWLNSGSSVDVRYDDASRRLRLHRGELLLATARDARPLQVASPHGWVRSLDARFSLRCDAAGSTLSVFEGAVVLDATGLHIEAGEQCRFDGGGDVQRSHAEVRREAWSRGLLVADNLSLDLFVEEFGQHHRAHFEVAPAVAALRLVGTYPLDDLDRTLATLQETLPVVVRRPLPWWIGIDARA